MTKKILIVGPSWVGDMIMAQALFKLLKNQDAHIQLDVLAPEWSALVLQRMPEVQNVILMPVQHGKFGLKQRWEVAQQLRRTAYDQAIVLPNSWKSALIPWFARIPLRTGWLGELRWGLLNDVRYLDKTTLPKMVQRYVALGLDATASMPQILPDPSLCSAPDALTNLLNKFDVSLSQPVLAICPGAAYGPAKRWPSEYFVELAQRKISEGWQVWCFGSQQDSTVIETICAQIPMHTHNFAGKINLLETIDLLAAANAVVSNDSGLLHMAASLNKPVVAIYGSTSAEFTPPLGPKSKILQESLACRPCFKRECPLQHLNCMYLIKPDKVISALTALETQ